MGDTSDSSASPDNEPTGENAPLIRNEESGNAEVPENAEAPATSEAPTAAEAPVNAEAPGNAEFPVTAEVPATSEAPTAAEAPATSEGPTAAEAPGNSEVPVSDEAPSTAEAPEIAEVPATDDAPSTSEAPANAEAPIIAEPEDPPPEKEEEKPFLPDESSKPPFEPGPSVPRSQRFKTMSMGKEEDLNRAVGEPRVRGDYRHGILQPLQMLLRKKVSQKRHRSLYQNINLDAAYITDRIIAIGYPSKGFEAHVRNPMDQTREYLWRRHGSNNVKVFNLRSGYLYDPRFFDDNVIYMDMTDHHPPRLELMAPFCREAKEWLDANDQHVIAVHCKAGKGRTGVMICALLIYMNYFKLPRQVLDYYSIVRTANNQGVTIPSQRRYIYYYSHLRDKKLNYFPLRQQLMGIYIERPPHTGKGKSKLTVTVHNGAKRVFKPENTLTLDGREYRDERNTWQSCNDAKQGNVTDKTYIAARAYSFMVPHDQPVYVEGDVRVDLLKTKGNKKIGHVWFNTMFTCGQNFEYGDKRWPYAEGETSIAKHKKDFPEGTPLLEDPSPTASRKNWKILAPDGLNTHTTEEALVKMYDNYGIDRPRLEIAKRLYKAHDEGIVQDLYNNRRFKSDGVPYLPVLSDISVRKTGGPFKCEYPGRDHVLTFPVYEMDRALKDPELNNGMKLHVVLRCLDKYDEKLDSRASRFCEETFTFNNKTDLPSGMREFARPKPPKANAIGADKLELPAVWYAKDGGYQGRPHPALNDDKFQHNPLASSQRWCRYFYRQRSRSLSEYPDPTHVCTFTNRTHTTLNREDPPPPPPKKKGFFSRR